MVAATPAPPDKEAAVKGKREYFLRMGVSQKSKQESRIFFGRVTPTGIWIMLDETQSTLVKFSPLEDDQATKENKAAEKKQAMAKEAAIGVTTPALQFQFSGPSVKTCQSHRDFRTFLKQMPLFRTVISDFEVRAAGPSSRDCALRLKTELEQNGFPTKVTVGPLKEGGIIVRAKIVGEQDEQPMEDLNTPEPVRLEADDLWVETSKGEKIPLLVREGGTFFKTFDPAKLNDVIPLKVSYLGRYGQIKKSVISRIPRVFEGENRLLFEDIKVAQVYPSTMDEITTVEVPRQIVQYIAEEQPPVQAATLTALFTHNTAVGNGMENQSFYTPAGLEGSFRLNSRIFLMSSLRLPVSFSTDNFTLTHIDADVNYMLYGADINLVTPFRLYVGGGGFVFVAKQKQALSVLDESSFLQEFLGVYASLGVQYRLKWWPLTVGYSTRLAPLPATPVNSASTSYMNSFKAEYCFNSIECGVLDYQTEKFEIIFKTTGRSYREQTFTGLGYKRVLW